jgi:hypothetical protein
MRVEALIPDAAQMQAQQTLGQLVPGAEHITNTDSGHEMEPSGIAAVTSTAAVASGTAARQLPTSSSSERLHHV